MIRHVLKGGEGAPGTLVAPLRAARFHLLARAPLDLSACTQLDDPVETALFAQLVGLAVKTLRPRTVLDVGCGCGIPTLAAARAGANRVVGIDISAENIELTRVNIQRARLQERVTALHVSWDDVCARRVDLGHVDLLVANPPYVPAGEGVVVDGGATGTRMIEAIVHHLPSEARGLALLFGSLSDPLRVLEMFSQRGLEVAEILLHSVPFGRYTSHPPTLAHLEKLREEGTAWFFGTSSTSDLAPYSYLTLGIVARVLPSSSSSSACVAQLSARDALAALLSEYRSHGPRALPEGPSLLAFG